MSVLERVFVKLKYENLWAHDIPDLSAARGSTRFLLNPF